MAISLAAETQPPAFKLYLCIAITVFCWGYSPIGVHSALHSYTPQHIALLRFLIASVFLLLLVMKKGIQPLKWKDVPALGLLGFFSVTLHHLLINTGQQYVSAVASSILSQSIPLFTFIVSAFFFKEKIRFKQWLCILLGLCGAVLVVSGDRGFGAPSPYSLLIVLAAIAWAIYFNLYKKFALNYDALSMMCYIIWFGTIPLLFYSAQLSAEILHATWQANMSLPDYSIQDELKQNQLMIVPMKESVLSVDIYLYRSSARLNTTSEGLWNFVKAIDWTIA